MRSEKVPHDSFREGFIVGIQMIRGTNAAIPGIPGTPGVPGNSSAFLLGVAAGLKSAGAEIVVK